MKRKISSLIPDPRRKNCLRNLLACGCRLPRAKLIQYKFSVVRCFITLIATLSAIAMGQDAYEVDDTPAQASIFSVGDTEQHNFHSALDEDWVKFHAPTGLVFNIVATQLGTNSDLRLELYYENDDGSLELMDEVDLHGAGSGTTEQLQLNNKTTNGYQLPGIYYVRVSSADSNLFGPGSEYTLQIYQPTGGSGGVILLQTPGSGFGTGGFYVMMGPPEALAGGAGWQVQELGDQTYYSSTNSIYGLPAPVTYTLAFHSVPGFLTPANYSLSLASDQTKSVLVYYTYNNLAPKNKSWTVATNRVCKLAYLGYAGKRYSIEESTNLPVWKGLVTNQVAQDGSLRFATTNPPTKTKAFYRARLVP